MPRPYTHVQELLPGISAMKEEGYTYRQIANQFGSEQVIHYLSHAESPTRLPRFPGRPLLTAACVIVHRAIERCSDVQIGECS